MTSQSRRLIGSVTAGVVIQITGDTHTIIDYQTGHEVEATHIAAWFNLATDWETIPCPTLTAEVVSKYKHKALAYQVLTTTEELVLADEHVNVSLVVQQINRALVRASTIDIVENWLLVAPIHPQARLSAVARMARLDNCPRVSLLLRRIIRLQGALRQFIAAWGQLPAGMFTQLSSTPQDAWAYLSRIAALKPLMTSSDRRSFLYKWDLYVLASSIDEEGPFHKSGGDASLIGESLADELSLSAQAHLHRPSPPADSWIEPQSRDTSWIDDVISNIKSKWRLLGTPRTVQFTLSQDSQRAESESATQHALLALASTNDTLEHGWLIITMPLADGAYTPHVRSDLPFGLSELAGIRITLEHFEAHVTRVSSSRTGGPPDTTRTTLTLGSAITQESDQPPTVHIARRTAQGHALLIFAPTTTWSEDSLARWSAYSWAPAGPRVTLPRKSRPGEENADTQSADQSVTDAELEFAEFLRRRDTPDSLEFASFCNANPDVAPQLESLWRGWDRVRDLVARRERFESVRARIYERHGTILPSAVALQETLGDATVQDMVGRLAVRHSQVSKYEFREEIARGGMGRVLRAWDKDIGRHVALKLIHNERGGANGQSARPRTSTLRRFISEAQVTGQLDHPGIVPVYELGIDNEGLVFYTMKHVRGRSLHEIFDLAKRGADGWTETRILNIFLRICEAVAFAHTKGVIHRDLKPTNIMVGDYGEVYVMDWGLARVRNRRDEAFDEVGWVSTSTMPSSGDPEQQAPSTDAPHLTMDGMILGTPPYMSPEQAHGDMASIDEQTDVYSLGAMLYHLMVGTPPFVLPGSHTSARTVLGNLLNGPPIPIATYRSHTPELTAIAEKAMARDKRNRYGDVASLARDLGAFLEGRVVTSYEHGPFAETMKWVRRNRLTTALFFFSVALISVVVWLLTLVRVQ